MNSLPDHSFSFSWFELSLTVLLFALISTTIKYSVLADDDERPVEFRVNVPEQCDPNWKGEVLPEPALKVDPEQFPTKQQL